MLRSARRGFGIVKRWMRTSRCNAANTARFRIGRNPRSLHVPLLVASQHCAEKLQENGGACPPPLRKLVATLLTRAALVVDTASDGEQALHATR